MKKFQLIGKKLGHSFSKIIHEKFNEYSYSLHELGEEDIEPFMSSPMCDGFNVTIPYKTAVMPYLDEIDEHAKSIGCVNTVVVQGDKKKGYNTDFYGMKYCLNRAGISVENSVVMILGSGGTSMTATAVATAMGAKKIIHVSRNGAVNYNNIYECSDVQVIINTTPVGMYPNNYDSLIDLNKFPNIEGVLDAIYNPLMTKLIFDAKTLNLKCSDGLPMLVAQAKFARDFYMDTPMEDSVIDSVLDEIKASMQNIVLIGMPGCGKSSIGKEVAERLNRKFVDMDEEIIKRSGKPIPQIFAEDGEEVFRDIENSVMMELGVQNNLVISTGGGVVKQDRNRYPMSQNSVIFYIDRPLFSLSTSGRPLSSSDEAVKKLYEERKDKYESWCDTIISNDGSIDKAVNAIINY